MTGQTPIEPATLRRISARNLLSFGPEGIDLELSALNVLIGPNGSGKSNLLEVIRLLKAAPHDLADPVRTGGGVSDWMWRGQPQSSATVEVIIDNPHGKQPLRHVIAFRESGRRFTLDDERIENEHPYPGQPDSYFYYRLQGGSPVLNVVGDDRRELQRDDVEPDQSILSQRKEPDQYPELAYLSTFYDGISLYGSWEFGRSAGIRDAQRSDVRPSPLTGNLSNLGMLLNRLAQYPAARARLTAHLTDLYEGVTDFGLYFDPSAVQLLFTEGDYSIPASRLSDGSLRYLFLLAVLLDPEPPRFLGVEEPEQGLHPDLLPKLADLLVDASSRRQLLVTTHSDLLIDALASSSAADTADAASKSFTVRERRPADDQRSAGRLGSVPRFGRRRSVRHPRPLHDRRLTTSRLTGLERPCQPEFMASTDSRSRQTDRDVAATEPNPPC